MLQLKQHSREDGKMGAERAAMNGRGEAAISQQVHNSTLMRFFTEILHKKRIILRQLDHLKELKISMTFGFIFFFSILGCWVRCRNPADL